MLDYLFLGTGGGMPMTFRALSSMMINYNGRKILIDCGEGTQVQMRKNHTGFVDIDVILLTHLHGDHIFGIPGLISTIGNSDRTEKLLIIGPPGTKEVIAGLLFSLNILPYKVEILEKSEKFYLTQNKIVLDISEEESELIIEPFLLKHRVVSHGYNILLKRKPKFDVEKAKKLNLPVQYWKHLQNGEIVEYNDKKYYPEEVLGDKRKGIKISYIGDTKYFKELSEYSKEADLLVSEGTYGDDEDKIKAKKNTHMTFRDAATIAKDAGVKQLIVTHFSPAMNNPMEFKENVTSVFSNSYIAYDGFKGTVSFEED